jgi:hypothetical protein
VKKERNKERKNERKKERKKEREEKKKHFFSDKKINFFSKIFVSLAVACLRAEGARHSTSAQWNDHTDDRPASNHHWSNRRSQPTTTKINEIFSLFFSFRWFS